MQPRYGFANVFAVALLAAAGCGHQKDDADLNSVKPALVLNPAAQNSAKSEVVILYANETDPTAKEAENYRAFIEALSQAQAAQPNETGKARLGRVISSLQTDLQVFKAEIGANVQALADGICRPGAESKQGLIVFTNKMAREGTLQYCLPGQALASDADSRAAAAGLTATYRALDLNNFIVESNPLSTQAMLQAALAVTKNLFHADQFEYVLITSSHGSERFAIAPKLPLDIKAIDVNELVRQIVSKEEAPAPGQPINQAPDARDLVDKDGRQQLDKDGRVFLTKDGRMLVAKDGRLLLDKDGRVLLDKDGRDMLAKDGRLTLDKDGRVALDKDGRVLLEKDGRALLDKDGRALLDKDGRLVLMKDGRDTLAFPAVQLDPAAKNLGVTKEQMIGALGATSQDGVYFRVVYLDSCKSFLDEFLSDLAGWERPNVGRIYTTDAAGIEYRNVDYGGFAAAPQPKPMFSQWLSEYLDNKAKQTAPAATPQG